jgi:hypothetical protein
VTSVTVELAPLASLYGGSLTFDAEHIAPALTAWVEYIATADERVSTSVAILRLPDLPFLPEAVRGHTLLSVRFVFPGDAATGERLAAPLRAAAPVYIDALTEIPATEIGSVHSDPTEPTIGWTLGRMLSGIDQDFAEVVLGFAGPDQQVPLIAVEIRAFGARQATDVEGGSAVGGRGAKGSLNLVGVPDPELFERVLPGIGARVLEAVAPWTSPENNVNFASGFRTADEYRGAWSPATFERLAEIKKKYDPSGLFVYGTH